MSEEEQGTKVEETVPDQETQVTETPPEAEVPKEQETAPETPATPDSETETATPEKDIQQLKDDRAHFQTEAQKAKQELADLRPEQVETPDVSRETPANELDNLTNEELNERLRDDPILMMKIQNEHLAKTVQRQIDDNALQAQTNAEESSTKKILRTFCAEHKITAGQFESARNYISERGINASPSVIGELLIDRMNMAMMQDGISQSSTQAAAKAAQAQKTQTLTTQPGASGPSATPEPKTQEQVIQDKFKRSTSQSAIDSLYN